MPELSDAQKYFLQIFLTHGIINQMRFKELFAAILRKFQISFDPENIKTIYPQFINKINDAIRDYNLEIRNGQCEHSGVSFYCLIRSCDTSSIGKISTLYSPKELKIFRKILRTIIESDDGYVEYDILLDAVINHDNEVENQENEEPQQITISPVEVRSTVQKFINDFWLQNIKTPDNQYTNSICIHGRTILELSEYIVENYGELVKKCQICKNIVISGISCEQENCSVKMHNYCAKRLFANQKNCSKCKIPFSDEQLSEMKERYAAARAFYIENCQ
jgi:non-structural maintenance of chromosomes element 1